MLFLNAGIYARLAAHEALSKLRGSPTTSQLEARLRPTLFPTERLSDADSWSVNMRLLAWLRSAYLSSLPESQAALPAARAERSHRLQHLDSAEAPSMAAARAIFGLSHPTGSLRSPALSRAIERASRAAARPGLYTVSMNVTFLRVDRDSLEIRSSLFGFHCSEQRAHTHTCLPEPACATRTARRSPDQGPTSDPPIWA